MQPPKTQPCQGWLAGPNPVASARATSGLTLVESEEGFEIGSWLHRCDPIVLYEYFLEDLPRQLVALLLRCPPPRFGHIAKGLGQQSRRPKCSST